MCLFPQVGQKTLWHRNGAGRQPCGKKMELIILSIFSISVDLDEVEPKILKRFHKPIMNEKLKKRNPYPLKIEGQGS